MSSKGNLCWVSKSILLKLKPKQLIFALRLFCHLHHQWQSACFQQTLQLQFWHLGWKSGLQILSQCCIYEAGNKRTAFEYYTEKVLPKSVALFLLKFFRRHLTLWLLESKKELRLSVQVYTHDVFAIQVDRNCKYRKFLIL